MTNYAWCPYCRSFTAQRWLTNHTMRHHQRICCACGRVLHTKCFQLMVSQQPGTWQR